MSNENETLRWPTNLDRAAIVERLIGTSPSGSAVEAAVADVLKR